ncbi:hypothetical protein RhiJN_16340 [Ceratobasidium sp. AG-Ba]|nr:hypothetical protein RhiJN_16340 [Ceratobasidium sp. AG-Ba]
MEVFKMPYLEAVRRLILYPSNRVLHTLRELIVVVIDGLQVGEGVQPEHSLLGALLEISMAVPIRIVCTARTGSCLYHWINCDSLQGSVTQLSIDDMDGSAQLVDIESYLDNANNNLPNSETLIEDFVGSPIPTVEHTKNATADHPFRLDQHQLVVELGRQQSGNYNLREPGDALLLADNRCASEAGETDANQMIYILACASGPLDLATLRHMTGGLDRTMISRLAPTVYFTAIHGRVGMSREIQFRLLDQSSLGRFCCGIKRTHSYLAQWCFDYIRNVRLCKRGNLLSGDPDDMEVSEEENGQARSIDDAMVYACSNWVRHLRLADPGENLWRCLSGFFSEMLFAWIEVMSRKCLLVHSCRMLHELRHYIRSNIKFVEALSSWEVQILDTYCFLKELITSGGGRSISQIYMSVFAHWPQDRFIYQTYARPFHKLPGVTALAENEHGSKGKAEKQRPNDQPRNKQLTGHTDWVLSVAYSPDGTYIASGSEDKTVRIWDAHTGQQVGHPLTGHTEWVLSVTYSPDGAYIASGSEDMTIRMWDARTGQQVGYPLTGHTDLIWSVAYSPDSAYVASGSSDNTIRMWDARTGQQVGHPLTGHMGSVRSVAYSPDGAYIASGSVDQTVRIWEAHTGQQVGHPFTGHADWVYSVAYSPDGAYIASGSRDNTIHIWDTYSGQQVGPPLKGHIHSVSSVAYSPDGAFIASGSDDKTIRIWDAHTGQQVRHPLTGHTSSVFSIAYSPDGAYIASGSFDNIIRIWNLIALNERPLSINGMFFLLSAVSYDFGTIHVHTFYAVLTTDGAAEVCVVDKNGWVLDKHGDRVIRIPPRVRRRFLFHKSDNEILALDLRGVKLGEAWHENLKDDGQCGQALDHSAIRDE